MSRKVLYHGSSRVVETPSFGIGSPNNDYGSAFYCTSEKEAAKEWACKNGTAGILNKYDIDERGLKILRLDKEHGFTVLHWLTLLLEHRSLGASFSNQYKKRIEFLIRKYHIDVESYDVVICYRADDAYFAFPKAFVDGSLTLESLEEIFELGKLGTQYAVKSEKAFKSLRFVSSENVSDGYSEKYKARIENANSDYAAYLAKSSGMEGTRIFDLMKDE